VSVVSYLVLARKYRPQSFQDLVGQEHVARTLANAIAQGRIAHAFLFTGVRGVGKTTSARLLAKCLNCTGADASGNAATGPTATPCQVCPQCTEIAAGSDIDVQEIDGASYNGVDEVRRLQEGLAFRPARDRYKIYIVDEVHMLSNAAWNAFLKTLEEPPPHVKFIFATTEVHKVPVTILSRCQRYDFKLISAQTIAARLRDVLAAEKIEADEASVATLAREAAGSMRDAMSLLDQVIAFSGTTLKAEDVTRVLGVADRSILHELSSALVDGDAATTLKVVDRLAQQGFDLVHVARDVLQHLRNLVLARVIGADGAALMDLAAEEAKDVLELAARGDADDLTRLYQGFSRSYDEIARSSHPRMALEMTLVRLARRPPLLPLDELLARLGELERRLAGGAAAAGGPAPSRGGGGGGGGGTARPLSIQPAAVVPANAGAPVSHVFPSRGAPPDAPTDVSRAPTQMHGSLALSADRAAAPQPVVPERQPTPTRPRPAPTAAPVAVATSPVAAASPAPLAPLAPLAPSNPPAPPAPPSPPPASRVVQAPVAMAAAALSSVPPPPSPPSVVPPHFPLFREIVERVRKVRPPLASILEHAVPLRIGEGELRLSYASDSILGLQAAESEALEIVQRAAAEQLGGDVKVTVDRTLKPPHAPGADGGAVTLASLDIERRRIASEQARAEVAHHPFVRRAIELFGAELRDVKIPPTED
jgi:DNA polymerase-3 subunit gamma/tau